MKSRMIGSVKRYDGPRLVQLGLQFPQSALPFVLIQPEALREMYQHAASEMYHEVGGYLLGFPVKDVETGVTATYIESAVRALYNSTPTYVTMHPESFNQVDRIGKKSNTILVGYYHSHPRLSVFQSGTDKKNFRDYHSEAYQIAVVVDPSKTREGQLHGQHEWIGYFGWNKEFEPIELPIENLRLVEKRPIELSQEETPKQDAPASLDVKKPVEDTDKPTSRLRNTIIGAFLEASELLTHGGHDLNSKTPIVILSSEVEEQITWTNPKFSEEGLLFGTVGEIAGYTLISVTDCCPMRLDGVQAYDEYLRSLIEKFPHKSLQEYAVPVTNRTQPDSLRPVGFYCWESRFEEIDTGEQTFLRWLFHRPAISLGDFPRYCGKYCLIALKGRKNDHLTIRFKAWRSARGVILECNQFQIVFRQGDTGGQVHTTENDQGLGSEGA